MIKLTTIIVPNVFNTHIYAGDLHSYKVFFKLKRFKGTVPNKVTKFFDIEVLVHFQLSL